MTGRKRKRCPEKDKPRRNGTPLNRGPRKRKWLTTTTEGRRAEGREIDEIDERQETEALTSWP